MADKPHPVDIHVGSRVRLRRTLRGMSQQRLAGELGLTFQQVQKYERGANRIGASRLYELSEVLDVPPSFFFEGITGTGKRRPTSEHRQDVVPATAESEQFAKREILELVRAYDRIDNREIRDRLFALVKAVSASIDDASETG